MADKLQLIAQLVLDSTNFNQGIDQISGKLQKARDLQQEVVDLFGANSAEAIKAAQMVAKIEQNYQNLLNTAIEFNQTIKQGEGNIEAIDNAVKDTTASIDGMNIKLGEGADELAGTKAAIDGVGDAVAGVSTEVDGLNSKLGEKDLLINVESQGIDKISDQIDGLPENKDINVTVSNSGIDEVSNKLDALPENKEVNVNVSNSGIDEATNKISEIPSQVDVKIDASIGGIDEIGSKIESLPSEKKLTVQATSEGINEVADKLSQLDGISDKEIIVTAKSEGVDDTISKISELDLIASSDKEVVVNVKAEGVDDAVNKVNELNNIPDNEVTITAKTAGVEQATQDLTELANIPDSDYNVNAKLNGEEEVKAGVEELQNIEDKNVSVNIDVNKKSALEQLEELEKESSGKKVVINTELKGQDAVKKSVDDTVKSVGRIEDELSNAKNRLKEVNDLFGEGSNEAKAVQAEVSKLEGALAGASRGAEAIDMPFKSLKAQLREANAELQNAVDKFGLASKEAAAAAARVAQLKDTIGDAKTLTDAFNPDAKFKGLSNAIRGAVGAFTALQGAQALFGDKSKELEETLAKVNGALALSQGVDSVLEAKDSFVSLGVSAKAALAGIRTGIAATGIGLLVVALGAIVAYWDDIKASVSGVSSEQEKLNKQADENLKAQEDKITALEGQEQQLKLQGKSEREILDLKVKQTDEAIKAAEIDLERSKQTKDAQVAAAARNKEILQGLLNLVSLPLTAILAGVDLLTSKLNKIGVLSDESFAKVGNLREKFTGGIAGLVFDPEKTAKEGDKEIGEAQKKLNELKEKRAGFQNSINDIDKQAAEKRAAERQKELEDEKKNAEERAKFSQETEKLIQDTRLLQIQEGYQRQRQVIEQQYQDQIDLALAQLDKGIITQQQYADRRLAIDKGYYLQLEELERQQAEKRAAFAAETENIIQQTRLAALQDGLFKQRALLDQAYDKDVEALLKLRDSGTIDQEQYNQRRLALDAKYTQDAAALQKSADDKAAQDRFNANVKALEDQVAADDLAYQAKKKALDDELLLLEEARQKGVITDDEYKKAVDKNSKDRQKIWQVELNVRKQQVAQFGQLLSNLSELVGKNTKAGKAAAVAGLVIQQAQTVAQVTTDTIASTKAIAKKYAGVPGGQIPAAVEIGLNIATGAASIAKAVQAVKKGISEIKGANEASAASGSADVGAGGQATASAPIPAQQETTALPQEQINQLATANAAVRAYVVESDVSGNQERITRLNRAARIS